MGHDSSESSKLNLHGGFFRQYGHLGLKKNLNAPRPSEHPPCLRQSTRVSFMGSG